MPVEYNEHTNRYELTENGYTAFAQCREDDGVFYINYVESPPELRGKGTAGRLMQGLVDIASEKNLEIKPICGYAAGWLQRHQS